MKNNMFQLIKCMAVLSSTLPAFTFCFVRNCGSELAGQGTRECLHVPDYDGLQWARCSNDSYMNVTSNGKHRCTWGNGKIKSSCWYPCQLEMFNANDGKVQKGCACGDDLVRNNAENENTGSFATESLGNKIPLNTLKNCSFVNDGERLCHNKIGYTRSQWIRCSSNAYIMQKSGGRYTCSNDELYCWFTCQQDKFHLGEGEVKEECYCDVSENNKNSSSSKLCGKYSFEAAFIVSILYVFLR